MSERHEQWDIVSGIGRTALAAAAGRARETRRPGGLISDPFAEVFVRAADPSLLPRDLAPADSADARFQRMITLHLATRTRYFDGFLAAAGAAGVRQVVVLAAGLDARALRLAWPGDTVLFEVDQPAVLAFKGDVLARVGIGARCDRRTVPVDLRDDWPAALLAAGFDPARPTAWLAEGLFPYLPADAEEALLAAVTAHSARGSRAAVEDFADRPDWPVAARDRLADMTGADVHAMFAIDDRPGPAERLRADGWSTRAELAEHVAAWWDEPALGHLTARFGTPSVDLVTAWR